MRKDSKLNAIQQDAQRVAEAISSSLELETEIVDETLTIVAGTGRYFDKVGLKEEGGDSQAGYIYGRVVTSGRPEIVEDAPNDPKYDPSVHIGTTAELAEICCPIIARGKVLGVIGLVAFSETQRDLLLKRKNQLVDFVHRIAELLASKAVETETLAGRTHQGAEADREKCGVTDLIVKSKRGKRMEKTEWLKKAAQSILDMEGEAAKEIAQKALEDGMDPLDMINEGFTEGIRKMGDLFDRGEVFLPGLLIASEAMTGAVEILEAALPQDKQQEKRAVIVIGTIEGDIHDIGKGIIVTMLRVYGYEVHDLGRDVPIDEFVKKAQELKADVVGSSAMMTTTQIGQKKLEKALKEAGLRDKVKTMVGGAVATDHWAKRIGADFFGETPQDTIDKLGKIFN